MSTTSYISFRSSGLISVRYISMIMRTSKYDHRGVVLMKINIVLPILLLLLGACACVANGMFLSIDCGGSDSYTDNHNIRWVGDNEYVRSGVSQSVGNVRPRVVSTVRVFSSLRKNCYTVPVTAGDRILVRASFYYGNFDGANSPPVFDLYFDATYWTKVNITGYSSYINNYEVIYVVKRNTTSICLAQTLPHQFPFISSLEFRSLGPNMYTRLGSGYALFGVYRFAFGAYQSMIRYPDDPYDREWYSASGLLTYNVRGEADISKMDVSGAEDYPPAAVLQNASTVNGTTSYIQLDTFLPDYQVPVYITTFFSEVAQLAASSPNYKRSFQIYVDDQPYSKVIVPPFGGVVEVAITNITASSKTSITLMPTSDANLPVLINAFEVYTVSELLSPGTHTRDLEGLAVLQLQFEVLIIWSGDPCLPSQSQWEWVQCSIGTIPRILSLNLSSFGLVGALPDFSSMDALVTIDLHDNGLEGPIPDFLGFFPYLKQLDLSNNRFNGTIPTSLSKNKNLKLMVTGNCLSGMSCPPPPPPPQPTPPADTTPPAEIPSPDSPLNYQAPEAPDRTPSSTSSSGSYKSSPPPPPYSTSTATNNTAAQLLILLLKLVLGAIIPALF